MNKIDFYQITDGQTGAQVASGLDDNFNAIEAAFNEGEERISGFRVPEGFGCSESRFDWYLSGLCT